MYERVTEYPCSPESPHSLQSRNSQRSTTRVKPAATRRADIRNGHNSGERKIRIWRKVLNEQDFASQLRVWQPADRSGAAKRKNYGQFTYTVFDSSQYALRALTERSESELTEYLSERCPLLFERLGPLAVSGLSKFSSKEPMIVLKFDDKRARDELKIARSTVAPEIDLDPLCQNLHQPHVSLGRIIAYAEHDRERITQELIDQLSPVVPTHVELGPARISITN